MSFCSTARQSFVLAATCVHTRRKTHGGLVLVQLLVGAPGGRVSCRVRLWRKGLLGAARLRLGLRLGDGGQGRPRRGRRRLIAGRVARDAMQARAAPLRLVRVRGGSGRWSRAAAAGAAVRGGGNMWLGAIDTEGQVCWAILSEGKHRGKV